MRAFLPLLLLACGDASADGIVCVLFEDLTTRERDYCVTTAEPVKDAVRTRAEGTITVVSELSAQGFVSAAYYGPAWSTIYPLDGDAMTVFHTYRHWTPGDQSQVIYGRWDNISRMPDR